jgi:uncharacterized protein (UPF0332 family)
MRQLDYSPRQKKRASTLLSLALSELEASQALNERALYREALVHMYFCCYYGSQSLLVKQVPANPSHRAVEAALHKAYGKSKTFPRRYVRLHDLLHKTRNAFNYQTAHSPHPKFVQQQIRVLQSYISFAFRVVPKIRTTDILESILSDNGALVRDFSYDVYCPKTYAHHVRLTLWQPPFYLRVFSSHNIQTQARRMLRNLRVRKSQEYVVGINSSLNQYGDTHLLMLDIDSLDATVETHLKKLGGVLLKSGRGFHFIGNKIIQGTRVWEQTMRQLKRTKELAKYLDHDHIDISLRRGYATLRVTTSNIKPHEPIFFKEL